MPVATNGSRFTCPKIPLHEPDNGASSVFRSARSLLLIELVIALFGDHRIVQSDATGIDFPGAIVDFRDPARPIAETGRGVLGSERPGGAQNVALEILHI